MNFELREMKLGLREIKLSCEVLDSQSHRRIPKERNTLKIQWKEVGIISPYLIYDG